MKLKYIAILLATILLATVAAWAVNTYVLKYPSTAQGQVLKITVYLDGEVWANNTLRDWGGVESDTEYWCYLNITNSGQLNCTVAMSTVDLPSGWDQVWSMNNAFLEPNEWANGTLTLTTATLEAVTYDRDTFITATQS